MGVSDAIVGLGERAPGPEKAVELTRDGKRRFFGDNDGKNRPLPHMHNRRRREASNQRL
jgi:hypothetical protein